MSTNPFVPKALGKNPPPASTPQNLHKQRPHKRSQNILFGGFTFQSYTLLIVMVGRSAGKWIGTIMAQASAQASQLCRFWPLTLQVRPSLLALTLCGFLGSCQTTTSPHHPLNEGNKLAKQGLYREAAQAYERVLDHEPHYHVAQRNLGIVLVHLGLYGRAYPHLTAALRQLPRDYQTNYYLAEVHRVRRQYSQAAHHYNMSLILRPGDIKASRGLAWTYYHNKKYHLALRVLAAIQPRDARVRDDSQGAIIRARIHLQLNNFGAALSLMNRQLRNADAIYHPFILAVLGDIYLRRNDYSRALHYYNRASTIKPHLSSALLGRGKIAYSQGKWGRASELLRRAVSVKRDLTEAYLYLGRIYQRTKPKKALAYYQKYSRLAQGTSRPSASTGTFEEVQKALLELPQKISLSSSAAAKNRRHP